jgi:hypothetical protein
VRGLAQSLNLAERPDRRVLAFLIKLELLGSLRRLAAMQQAQPFEGLDPRQPVQERSRRLCIGNAMAPARHLGLVFRVVADVQDQHRVGIEPIEATVQVAQLGHAVP